MPTTPISKEYNHTTCRISVQGETLSADDLAQLKAPVDCTIQLNVGDSSHQFEGDGEILHDLVTTIDRYLKYILNGQSQGTFSGSVAIRPIDAVRHRITLKQGNGVGQADLTTTQLYDLAESLGEVETSIPHLARLKSPAQGVAWFRRPAASVAALAVVSVGVVAATLTLSRPAPEQLGESEFRVDDRVSQLSESALSSADGGEPDVTGSTEIPLEAPTAAAPEGALNGLPEGEQVPNADVVPPPALAQTEDGGAVTEPPAPSTAGVEEGAVQDPSTQALRAQERAAQDSAPDDSETADPNLGTASSGDVATESEGEASSSSSSGVPSPQRLDRLPDSSADSLANSSLEGLPEDSVDDDARRREQLSAAQLSLQPLIESLGASWQAPESLTESLVYDVTLSDDGSILTAVPSDERAAEFQPQTPLADLPAASEQTGIPVTVSLEPDSSVTAIASPQP